MTKIFSIGLLSAKLIGMWRKYLSPFNVGKTFKNPTNLTQSTSKTSLLFQNHRHYNDFGSSSLGKVFKRGDKSVPYDNVIFLPNFRNTGARKKKQVLYISNHGESLELLQSFHGISVECASSSQSLNIQLFSWKRWDLILIESDLEWACAQETVSFIHHELQIPVTLIHKDSDTEESIFRLKAFYEAGLYDCLKTPLCPKELSEVFRTLIK